MKTFDLAQFGSDAELARAAAGAWLEEIATADRAAAPHYVALSGGRIASGFFAREIVAVEIPGRKRGMEKVVTLDSDVLTLFYRACWILYRVLRPILPKPAPPGTPPSRAGRALRAVFAGLERALSFLLPSRR